MLRYFSCITVFHAPGYTAGGSLTTLAFIACHHRELHFNHLQRARKGAAKAYVRRAPTLNRLRCHRLCGRLFVASLPRTLGDANRLSQEQLAFDLQ